MITEEIHMEWGERPTFLMTGVLHRRVLIKSLSTAVYYTQSHDHDHIVEIINLKILTAALVASHIGKICQKKR